MTRSSAFALDSFRHFLAQPRFPLSEISDRRHINKFVFTTGLLKPHNGRLGRWYAILTGANFRIEYQTGDENDIVADFLSRYQQEMEPPTGRGLLPVHRVSPSAVADIESWFRKEGSPNVRARLEEAYGKKVGSAVSFPLPRPTPCSHTWESHEHRYSGRYLDYSLA